MKPAAIKLENFKVLGDSLSDFRFPTQNDQLQILCHSYIDLNPHISMFHMVISQVAAVK